MPTVTTPPSNSTRIVLWKGGVVDVPPHTLTIEHRFVRALWQEVLRREFPPTRVEIPVGFSEPLHDSLVRQARSIDNLHPGLYTLWVFIRLDGQDFWARTQELNVIPPEGTRSGVWPVYRPE